MIETPVFLLLRRAGRALLLGLSLAFALAPAWVQTAAPQGATPQMADPQAPAPRAVVERVRVGDIEMGYYRRGSGPPLLMVMGLGASMGDWDPAFLEALARDHTLILFDNRGVGFSSDTEADGTTIPQMADDTAGLARALGYSSLDLLGYSMGAEIAQQVALRHPELVRALVLLAPGPGGTHQLSAPDGVLDGIAAHTLPTSELLALLFPQDEAGQAAARALLGRMGAARRAGTVPVPPPSPARTGARQMEAMRQWAASEENYEALPRIAAPTLAMDGRQDQILPPANVAVIAGRIPFTWTAYFPGGHLFWSQSHGQVAATIRAFLR